MKNKILFVSFFVGLLFILSLVNENVRGRRGFESVKLESQMAVVYSSLNHFYLEHAR